MEFRPLPPEALPLTDEARLERGADGRWRARYRVAIPFFGWLWRPLIARRARRVEAASNAGGSLPATMPWWAPPVVQDAATTASVAAVCLLSLVTSYAGGTGGLLTETLPYAARVYHVGDSTLALGLAFVRVGVVVALAIGALADRRGRRRLALVLAVAGCLIGSILGLAPSFEVYIAGHVVLRCVDTALGIALTVLIVELSPAGNRAINLSLALLASGGGLALAAAVLPLAAAGRAGFAAVYLLQLAALPFVFAAGRRLRESPRFLAAAQRDRRRYREVLAKPLRGRLVLIGAPVFLGAIFYAPSAEFFNRYLDRVRGFSSVDIVVFLAVTGAPAAVMVIVGGKLADVHGRKRIGVPMLALSTLALTGFYLTPEPWLWPLALIGQMLGAAGVAALAVYGSELFPTEVRSAANTLAYVIAVCGSAAGLLAASALAATLGIGPSIASLGGFALAGIAIVAWRYPETARLELEVTSGVSSK